MTVASVEAKVLVVDDEEHIRRLVRAILTRLTRKYGMKITEAANVDEALRALESDSFHLIVSDYSMPGRSGIDLLAEVHEKYPATARILVTALDQLDIGVEAINRGRVDAFLRKPWQNDAFIALADSLLAQRVANRDASAQASPAPALAQVPALGAPKTPLDKGALEAELAEVDRVLRQLRVRIGLGNISPEGYSRINDELTAKRASLELQILQLVM